MGKMSAERRALLKERARDLRKNMTPEEKHLWHDYLSGCRPLFHRQTVLDDYIVDFYCPKLKLIIELDGSQHYMGRGPTYDAKGRRSWNLSEERSSGLLIGKFMSNLKRCVDRLIF